MVAGFSYDLPFGAGRPLLNKGIARTLFRGFSIEEPKVWREIFPPASR